MSKTKHTPTTEHPAEKFDREVNDPKRARFWELVTEEEEHAKALAPLREQQDKLAQQEQEIHLKRKALEEKIKRAETPLLAVKREKAEIARTVFKVGERPTSPPATPTTGDE